MKFFNHESNRNKLVLTIIETVKQSWSSQKKFQDVIVILAHQAPKRHGEFYCIFLIWNFISQILIHILDPWQHQTIVSAWFSCFHQCRPSWTTTCTDPKTEWIVFKKIDTGCFNQDVPRKTLCILISIFHILQSLHLHDSMPLHTMYSLNQGKIDE